VLLTLRVLVWGSWVSTRIVWARLLGTWLLHLLPSSEYIGTGLCIFCALVCWPLRRGRSPKVLVREAVRAACVRVVLRRRLGTLLLGRGLRWGRAVVGAAGRGCSVGIARRRRRACSGRVRRVRRHAHIAVSLALVVVLLPLLLVAEDLVCSLDLLELGDEFGLVARIAIGVVLQREA